MTTASFHLSAVPGVGHTVVSPSRARRRSVHAVGERTRVEPGRATFTYTPDAGDAGNITQVTLSLANSSILADRRTVIYNVTFQQRTRITGAAAATTASSAPVTSTGTASNPRPGSRGFVVRRSHASGGCTATRGYHAPFDSIRYLSYQSLILPPPLLPRTMSSSSVTELRHDLGTGGTFFAGAGAAGVLVGLFLLVLLAIGVSPGLLTPVVTALAGATVGLLVATNVWMLWARRRGQ